MRFSYYAIFQYDIDGICISFPDFPTAFTCSENEEEGIKYAKEVLELVLHGMRQNEIPLFTPCKKINLFENQKLFLITAELDLIKEKLFSKNVIEF